MVDVRWTVIESLGQRQLQLHPVFLVNIDLFLWHEFCYFGFQPVLRMASLYPVVSFKLPPFVHTIAVPSARSA